MPERCSPLGLKPSTGIDTYVSRSSATFQATDRDHRDFGGDAVIILIKEPLTDLVETKDLANVTFLEACLAGQYVVPSQQLQSFQPAPPGAHAPYGGLEQPVRQADEDEAGPGRLRPGDVPQPRGRRRQHRDARAAPGAQQAVQNSCNAAYKLAIGRGLTKKQATNACKAASALEQQRQLQQLERLYLNSGINGTPRIDDPQFIPQIVFDQTRGVNQPKSRFAYLFPTANSAPHPGSAEGEPDRRRSRREAIRWIRQAVRMPMFRSTYGGTYTVTGAPVVLNDLSSQITGSIAGLLIAALLVMAATLLIVFRSRLRLLPLAIALAAAGITFGALSLVGGSLTMASIAVLPILIGLAVDYAVQFQSRVEEARAQTGTGIAAVARAAAAGAPTIAVAALATATGFLVLLLSPVPMVRGFGLLLVVGIVVALICALTAGSAALVLGERRRPRSRRRRRREARRGRPRRRGDPP